MRTGTFLGITLLAAMTLGVVACGGDDDAAYPTATPTTTAGTTPNPTPTNTSTSGAVGEVITVVHNENPYSFKPDKFTFEVGKTYIIKTSPVTEFHTYNVDELGIAIEVFAGDVVDLSFTPTADQVGTFKLYCIPHEGNGMVGEVTVVN